MKQCFGLGFLWELSFSIYMKLYDYFDTNSKVEKLIFSILIEGFRTMSYI